MQLSCLSGRGERAGSPCKCLHGEQMYEGVTITMTKQDLSLGYILYQKPEVYKKTNNQISCYFICHAWNWTCGDFFKDITSTSTYRGCKPNRSLKRRIRVLPFKSQDVPVGKSCMAESNAAENCMAKEEFGKAVGWKNEEYKCWVKVSMDENSRMVSIVLICSSLVVQKQAQLHLVTSDLRLN